MSQTSVTSNHEFCKTNNLSQKYESFSPSGLLNKNLRQRLNAFVQMIDIPFNLKNTKDMS